MAYTAPDPVKLAKANIRVLNAILPTPMRITRTPPRTLQSAKEFAAQRGMPVNEEQLAIWLFAYGAGFK